MAMHSYTARSLPLSAQRLVNYFTEEAPPDSKMPVVLYPTPGLKLWATFGSGPIRGLHDLSGTLVVASGDEVYTAGSDASGTLRGTFSRTGIRTPVAMADNGAEVALLSGGDGYTWDGTTLSEISDAAFLKASDVAFVDGFGCFTEEDGARFFISSANDMTSFDALERVTAEGKPDKLVGCVANHRELWLWGEQTGEVWFNSGAPDFPFERNQAAFIERGLAAKGSLQALDNTIFWLGDDLIVYRADGYTPMRVSTHPIEEAIRQTASPEDATSLRHSIAGHEFYQLNFAEGTFVFDVSTGMWHERQAHLLSRHRADCHVDIFGKTLVGDFENGKIYELDSDTYADDGGVLATSATSPPIHASTARATMSRFQIEFEAGVGLTTGQGSDPQAMLQFSDDGGRTWSNERWASIGAKGQNKHRAIWYRLGTFYERTMRVTMSDPVKRVIIAANAVLN